MFIHPAKYFEVYRRQLFSGTIPVKTWKGGGGFNPHIKRIGVLVENFEKNP